MSPYIQGCMFFVNCLNKMTATSVPVGAISGTLLLLFKLLGHICGLYRKYLLLYPCKRGPNKLQFTSLILFTSEILHKIYTLGDC